MTVTSAPPVWRPTQQPIPTTPTDDRRVARRVEAGTVLGVSFAAYFTVAMLLDFHYLSFEIDAISRMANGFYILHSRDPHLAAVGFVWNPLSSFADLPLLLFNSWFPVLASHDVAGTTMSAVAMAGAAYQLHALLREWRVALVPRLVLTAFFALNPMILYFGGNGMSEALYLWCTIAAARYLSRWLTKSDLRSLVYSGIALGFGYLERTEPVASAFFAVPLVLLVTFARTDGDRRHRIWTGFTDVVVFTLPVATSFVGWAVVSAVITGQPFAQIQSKYGNAALIKNSHEITGTLHDRLVHEVKAVTYLAPLLIVIVVAAIGVAIIRRSIASAGVILLLSGGIGFTLASFLVNAIFPWLRYYILIIPLAVLLVGSMFATPVRLKPDPYPVLSKPEKRGLSNAIGSITACVIAVVLLGVSFPSTVMAMRNSTIAPDVVQYTGYFFFPTYPLSDGAGSTEYGFRQVQAVAQYFENMHLPNGDVVTDNANACVPSVYTKINNPRIFVIHNDRDFQRELDDPLTFHAHYLLAGLPGNNDAVLAQYPNIGSDSWVKLVHTFNFNPGGYCSGFRLFRVIGHPGGNY